MNVRDVFFNRVYELARDDRDIIIISADLGAPSLDAFRNTFPDRFINVGIAEQNLLSVAGGLSLAGKKVIAYGLNPFPVTRAFDQLRNIMASMRIPLTLVLLNSPTSSVSCGYTHMPLENFVLLRSLKNVSLNIPSDVSIAERLADIACSDRIPRVIQLDKIIDERFYPVELSIEQGFVVTGKTDSVVIVSSGFLVKILQEIRVDLLKKGIDIKIIDCFSFPFDKKKLLRDLEKAEIIVTVEENILEGGLGTVILELLSDFGIKKTIKRLGVKFANEYPVKLENRMSFLEEEHLNKESLSETIMDFVQGK